MEKLAECRIAGLVGEAIKLMVEAGASADTIGYFARCYPAVVASKLEPLSQLQELDLEALVRVTVQAIFRQCLTGNVTESGAKHLN